MELSIGWVAVGVLIVGSYWLAFMLGKEVGKDRGHERS